MDDDADDGVKIHQRDRSTAEELFSLSALEISIGTLRHLTQLNMLDTDALQFFHFVSTCLDHASDLAVFSFGEDDREGIGTGSFYDAGGGLDKLRFVRHTRKPPIFILLSHPP